jgi:hypothetical protein
MRVTRIHIGGGLYLTVVFIFHLQYFRSSQVLMQRSRGSEIMRNAKRVFDAARVFLSAF